MPQPFDALREKLLRAGFPPGRVGRYCRELDDHLADLTADERAAGRDAATAQAAARERLGSDEALAAAMLMRPSLRSWTAKAPWAVLVLAPTALLLAASFATVAFLMSGFGTHPGPIPEALQTEIRDICGFENFQLPLLVSGLVGLWAARHRRSAGWAAVGVMAIACVSAALRLHVQWPGHDLSDPADWRIEAMPSAILAMWLKRFWQVGMLDLVVGLAVFWAATSAERRPGRPTPAWPLRLVEAPWASFVLLPVALLVGTYLLAATGLTAALGPHPVIPDAPAWRRFEWLYGLARLLPSLFAALLVLVAARRRASVVWPLVGLLALIGAGAALQLALPLPGDPEPWAVQAAGAPQPFVTAWLERFVLLSKLNLLYGMAIYLGARFGAAPAPRPTPEAAVA